MVKIKEVREDNNLDGWLDIHLEDGSMICIADEQVTRYASLDEHCKVTGWTHDEYRAWTHAVEIAR